MNLETHHIVDLLPDRRAETAAAWMKHRPDIKAVSRDRGGEYARAAAIGAPQATDVADRFHLCKNLTEALQLLLAGVQEEIKSGSHVEESGSGKQKQATIALHEWRPLEPASVEKARLARRAGRHTRYEQVVERPRTGDETQRDRTTSWALTANRPALAGFWDVPRSQTTSQEARVSLTTSLPTFSNAGNKESDMAQSSYVSYVNKDTVICRNSVRILNHNRSRISIVEM